MSNLFYTEALIAETMFYPSDSTAFKHVWEEASTISSPTSRVYKNGVDISSDVLTSSDSASNNIQTSKVLTVREIDAGSTLTLEFRCVIEGKTKNRRLLIKVPRFTEGEFIDEDFLFPVGSTPLIHVWNSAATISTPTSRVYKGGQDISSGVLSGSDSASDNVQTSKILTPRAEDAGSQLVFEWRAVIEGKTLNARALIIVPAYPR